MSDQVLQLILESLVIQREALEALVQLLHKNDIVSTEIVPLLNPKDMGNSCVREHFNLLEENIGEVGMCPGSDTEENSIRYCENANKPTCEIDLVSGGLVLPKSCPEKKMITEQRTVNHKRINLLYGKCISYNESKHLDKEHSNEYQKRVDETAESKNRLLVDLENKILTR